MFSRASAPIFLDLLQEFPAVAILGPRQVGKTTLAHQLCEHWPSETQYLDLELPSDQARLRDAEAYLGSLAGKLVVLDEVQRMPELFATLRGLIDQRRRAGLRSGQAASGLCGEARPALPCPCKRRVCSASRSG